MRLTSCLCRAVTAFAATDASSRTRSSKRAWTACLAVRCLRIVIGFTSRDCLRFLRTGRCHRFYPVYSGYRCCMIPDRCPWSLCSDIPRMDSTLYSALRLLSWSSHLFSWLPSFLKLHASCLRHSGGYPVDRRIRLLIKQIYNKTLTDRTISWGQI